MSNTPLFEALSQYFAWAPTVWVNDTGSEYMPLQSLFVATAGLSGETGEVIEAIILGASDQLEKELGDVFYYWTILANRNGFTARDFVWESKDSKLPKLFPAAGAVACLAMAQAQVCECLKKQVRGDSPVTGEIEGSNLKLKAALQEFLEIWILVCQQFASSSISSIWFNNQAKVDSRKARGVLLGSGNDR